MKISKMVLIFCLLILSATLVSCSNTESTWQNSSSDNSSDSISQSKSTTSEYTTVNTTVDTVKSVTEATIVTTAATSKTALQSTSAPHTDDVQIIASGSCGDTGSDVKWTLDHDGCLRIIGNGKIKHDSFNGEKTISEISSDFTERYKDMRLEYAVEKLIVENGISSIGTNAFKSLGKLSTVSIPESISAIGSYAFKETQWLENQQKKDPLVIINNIVIDAEKCSGSLTIPRNVKTISDQAFSLNNNIVSIEFSNGITHIGSHMWCSNLQKISIPSSATGNFGFSYCDKLTNVLLAEGIKNIGDFAFIECKTLKSIIIPKSVINIGKQALGYQGAGTERWWTVQGFTIKGYVGSAAEKYAKANGIGFVDIEKKETTPTVKIIASGNCGDIISFEYPDKITYKDNVKWELDSAGTLSIHGSGKTGDWFIVNDNRPWRKYTSNIKKVVIANGVTRIGDTAFENCRNLSSVTIPNSVKTIGDSAFTYTKWLEDMHNKNQLVIINSILIDATKYQYPTLRIPNTVTSISGGTFYDAKNIREIIIPQSVTYIGKNTFLACYGVDTIFIPKTVKVIENNDCSGDPGYNPAIQGYAGSAAEKFAKFNDYRFIKVG